MGLVENCRALFVVTKGGIYSRGPQQREDFLEPYLKAIFGFVGIRDTTFVTAEGLAIDAEIRKEAVAAAKASLNELAMKW
jgi:FMN-dependent NADH-azoreductase